jgi:beta-lactamase class D
VLHKSVLRKENEEYKQLRAYYIAEKFKQGVEYWFDLDVEVVAVEQSKFLQHLHQQKGAVIGWLLR